MRAPKKVKDLMSVPTDYGVTLSAGTLPIPPQILELVPVAIYTCDAAGRVQGYNARAARLWGRSPLIGDNGELYGGAHRIYDSEGHAVSPDETPMAYVLKTGSSVHGGSAIIERPDGSRVVALVDIDAVRDGTGRVVGAVGCINDISEQKSREDLLIDAEQHQRDLVAGLPVAIFSCDAQGRIVSFNKCAAEVWGRSPRLNDDTDRYCGCVRAFDANGLEIRREHLPVAEMLATGRPLHGCEALIERPDGSRLCVVAHVDPVRDSDGRLIGGVACFVDITDGKNREGKARDDEQRWRDLLDALPAAIYTTDAEGILTFFNRAAVDLSGHQPKIGSDRWCVSWKLYNTDGSPLPLEDCPMAVTLKENKAVRGAELVAERPDGTRVPLIPYPTPLHDEDGHLTGAINMLVDIRDRKTAEARQKILIDELNHRVKNTLATVQSLAAQSMRNTGVTQFAREAFDARLFALSRTHDQLMRERWASVELRLLAQEIFSPHNDEGRERIRLWGGPIRLEPETAITLGMIFHELATNAAKFGALSAQDGVVGVSWREVGDAGARRLIIDWQEDGGPTVGRPQRKGLGSRLLERGIVDGLNGIVRIDYDPAGFRCTIEIPGPEMRVENMRPEMKIK